MPGSRLAGSGSRPSSRLSLHSCFSQTATALKIASARLNGTLKPTAWSFRQLSRGRSGAASRIKRACSSSSEASSGERRSSRITGDSSEVRQCGLRGLRADPTRVYIVGVRPWTWWAAMRPLFATIAAVSLLLALTSLLFDLAFARE